jgi:leader peptidase (prepilin peptidase)/N-methyltransferase
MMMISFEAFLTLAAASLGAACGSFLNVCIYRLPREGLGIARPARSFCPACKAQIAWYDNIPIFSWLWLGGRCRACRAPISLRYLLVEALAAMLFAVIARHYILDLGGSWGGCAVLLALVSGLIVAAFIDIDVRLIPDEITIGGMHLLLPAVVLFPDLHLSYPDGSIARLLAALEPHFRRAGEWLPGGLAAGAPLATLVIAAGAFFFAAGSWLYFLYRRRFLPEEPRRLRDVSLAGLIAASTGGLAIYLLLRPDGALSPRVFSLLAALLGMATGAGLVHLVGVVGSRVFRKPAMGFGDVKLMGLLGGFAGWWGALAGFFVACMLGSIIGIGRWMIYRDRYLPFGPFLATGCLFLILWPGAFLSAVEWYFGLFQLATESR